MDFFSRRTIYGWFNRWFDKADAGVEEAEYDAAPDSSLNVTSSGQVSTSLGGRSIVQLNTDRAAKLLPPSEFANDISDTSPAGEIVRAELSELLALPPNKTALHAQILSCNVRKGQRIEEIQFESEPGVRIVGWFITPQDGRPTHPCILHISNGFADDVVAEPSAFDGLLDAGYAVCAIAVRGTGLSTPRPPKGGPVFYQQMDLSERFAWANLVLGTSVICQRVWDIVRTVDYLVARPDVDASQIRMIGQEEAGIAALMAAALDDRVCSILLTRMVVTYMSIVQSTEYSLALEWFVPGILRHFDLPDIVASVSPKPVRIIDTVDASGTILSVEAVQATYSHRIGRDSAALKNFTIVTSSRDSGDEYLDWVRVSHNL
jgi:pimeloyl-ACP methyl ester carboxylesterase